jgi:hypothetical protein
VSGLFSFGLYRRTPFFRRMLCWADLLSRFFKDGFDCGVHLPATCPAFFSFGSSNSNEKFKSVVLGRVFKMIGMRFLRERLAGNETRRPFPQKSSGRRVFGPATSLSRSSQPAVGMFRPLLLVAGPNPSPPHPEHFEDKPREAKVVSGLFSFVRALRTDTLQTDQAAV